MSRAAAPKTNRTAALGAEVFLMRRAAAPKANRTVALGAEGADR